jgi:hypothetical protein
MRRLCCSGNWNEFETLGGNEARNAGDIPKVLIIIPIIILGILAC